MIKIKTNHFNLNYTLTCGQCFRAQKINDNTFYQILSDRVVKIKQDWDIIKIESNTNNNLEKIIRQYFDLDTDYNKLESEISKIDSNISKAIKNTSWLRILNQNFFETIISYIISANNNIPRISKSINKISEKFGEKIEFDNNIFYLFPSPENLKKATIQDLQDCWTWYRAPYIIDTVSKFCHWELNLNPKEDTEILRKKLLKFKWIGPKVADCILLFSLQKKDSFPIDTRVEKVMNELYIHSTTNKNIKKDIQKYVKDNFWDNAWLIQEHLFYNKRMWRL